MGKCAAFEGTLAIQLNVSAHFSFVSRVLGFVEIVLLLLGVFFIVFCWFIQLLLYWLLSIEFCWSELIFYCERSLHLGLIDTVEV